VKVWIDLANSPHPLLFGPVARRLGELGHEVLVTSRDNAQTLELARERWPDVEPIGSQSPPGRAAKAWAIVDRIRELRRWAARTSPDVALSHNSYAQIVAAASLRLPAVTGMDYEHQPANHVAFRLARRILLPESLPLESVRRQGAVPGKVVTYDGLKEELYLGDFHPNPDILAELGIDERSRTVVVMRAPPRGAMYHQFENPLYDQLLARIAGDTDTVGIVLARYPEQRAELARREIPNCLVPNHALDSRSLLYAADIFVGAGGTMTREAALIGIPTYSIYAGAPPAVERWLERRGLLTRVTAVEDVDLRRRSEGRAALDELRRRGARLIEQFVSTATEAVSG
jgi:predicted glycosyltransferase